MTSHLAFAAVNGIVLGMAVFLVAAGLTLVFGILRIFNFAHGSFFMIGAYIAHALIGREPSSVWFYGVAALAAAAVIGAIGLVTDRVVLRRLEGVSNDYSLIATFAILLLAEGADETDLRPGHPYGLCAAGARPASSISASRSPTMRSSSSAAGSWSSCCWNSA